MARFVGAAAWLATLDEAECAALDDDAFWINVYNALVMHATVVIGGPANTPDARTAFFSGATGAAYDVGGHRLSLDDIEHGAHTPRHSLS